MINYTVCLFLLFFKIKRKKNFCKKSSSNVCGYILLYFKGAYYN